MCASHVYGLPHSDLDPNLANERLDIFQQLLWAFQGRKVATAFVCLEEDQVILLFHYALDDRYDFKLKPGNA